MADREKADIDADVLQPVEEKDHTEQEQQMIISGDHVLGTKINEGNQVYARYFLDLALVAFRDGMGSCGTCHEKQGADHKHALENRRAEHAAAASEET